MQQITLHFTTKKISLEEVKTILVKLPELFQNQPLTINHCFLDRELVESKGWGLELVEFFEELEKTHTVKCWMKGFDLSDINNQRQKMFDSIFENEGSSVFIGPIVEGVEVEHDIVNNMGIPYFSIR